MLKYVFGNHQGRDSEAITAIPIWANGIFRPLRVRLIRGKTELLSGMRIVKKLGVQVASESDQFKVGQGEWEMMTLKEKNHWVFPWFRLLAITLNWMNISENYKSRKWKLCRRAAILGKIRRF